MLVVTKIANQIYRHELMAHQQAYRTVSGQSNDAVCVTGRAQRQPKRWM